VDDGSTDETATVAVAAACIASASANSSAGERQQPVLHVLDEWLVPPRPEPPANREDTALAGGAAGQLYGIDCVMQHCARLLRIALEHKGGREVRQDHRLVLLPARTETQRCLLENCLGTSRILQMQLANTCEPAELLPGEDPKHRVVAFHLDK
jgi:hypothetical protein